MKTLLPILAAPVLLPTLTGLFALVIALAPVILLGMVLVGLILKYRD